MILLENEIYTTSINPLGAEMKSIFHKASKKELVYLGDSPFWNRSAPVLFPIVGRLKNEQFAWNNKTYTLSQHGFARNLLFEVMLHTPTKVVFLLKDNAVTQENYPFPFNLEISYELIDDRILCQYQVHNSSEEMLHFSIGGHPGFNVPIFEDEQFSDYYLEWPNEENLVRHYINTTNGLYTGETHKLASDGKILPLTYTLFTQDALVFKQLKNDTLKLKNKNNTYELQFTFQNFSTLGIWTKPNAPFLCIEPWNGHADNENASGELKEKEGNIILEPKSTFECSYCCSFKLS